MLHGNGYGGVRKLRESLFKLIHSFENDSVMGSVTLRKIIVFGT